MIKVMVADDHVGLNHAYCDFLSKDKDIQIVCSTFLELCQNLSNLTIF